MPSPVARLLLLAAALAVSLVVVELSLRVVERLLLSGELTGKRDRYDLASLGYNDGQIDALEAPGEYRVLSFGDSFTYSITPHESSWNGVAARQLSQRTGREVRIVNLGVRARSFPTYISQWRFWSQRLEHDAVLFQIYLGNDLSDLRAVRHVRQVLEASDEPNGESLGPASDDLYLRTGTALELPSFTSLRVLDHVWAAYLRWSHRADDAVGYLDTTQVPWSRYVRSMGAATHPYRDDADARAETLDGWAAAVALLDLTREIDAAGKDVAILLAPPALFFQDETRAALLASGIDPARLDTRRPARLLAALAARRNVDTPILDAMPCLETAPTDAELYLGTNSHWTLAGNRVVGECVAADLASLWFTDRRDPGRAGSMASAERSLADEIDRIETEHEAARRVRERLRRVAIRVYANRADFEATLDELGWSLDDARPRGSLDGVVRAGRTPNAAPAEALGWLVDPERPHARSTVVVVADGRLVGFARTMGRRTDVEAALQLDAERAGFVAFRAPLSIDCDALSEVDAFWAYGLGDDGRAAPVPLSGSWHCEQ